MCRFAVKILEHLVFLVIAVLFTLWLCLAQEEKQVSRVYDIPAGVDTIFLGSSQEGCSIVERPEYHNCVIWVSQKVIYSALARLRELESRGQLSKIKNCIVYWNVVVLAQQQNRNNVNESWWSEFPVTWNKSDLFPSPCWSKVVCAATHLQWPMTFTLKETRPDKNLVVAQRDENWKHEFYNAMTNKVANHRMDSTVKQQLQNVMRCYFEMSRICRAHGIRFIVVGFSILNTVSPYYPNEYHQAVGEVVAFLQANGVEYVPDGAIRDETMYFDAVHMTERTAEQYTAYLYKKLGL